MISLGLIVFFLYFTYSAIYGNNGLKKNIELEFKIIELNNKLNSLEKIMTNMEKKTSKLSKSNLDLDLLDEQSRLIRGLIRNDEIMLTLQ